MALIPLLNIKSRFNSIIFQLAGVARLLKATLSLLRTTVNCDSQSDVESVLPAD